MATLFRGRERDRENVFHPTLLRGLLIQHHNSLMYAAGTNGIVYIRLLPLLLLILLLFPSFSLLLDRSIYGLLVLLSLPVRTASIITAFDWSNGQQMQCTKETMMMMMPDGC